MAFYRSRQGLSKIPLFIWSRHINVNINPLQTLARKCIHIQGIFPVSTCCLHCESSLLTKRHILQGMLLKDEQVSVHHAAGVPIKQGLFHVDLNKVHVDSESAITDSQEFNLENTKVLNDNEVYYTYNKTMYSVSSYLQREKEKLAAQPRTENELYYAKYTPRLFYLERQDYVDMAACLPTFHLASCDSVLQDEFLNTVSKDDGSYFSVSFIMDGIQLLLHNSDEWLLGLNNDARFLRLCLIIRATCCNMSDEELSKVLKFLARVQVRTRNSVLPALFEECCKRVNHMKLKLRLLFSDAWRMIGYPVPHFNERMFAASLENIGELTTPEFVQMIYLVGENRHVPKEVENKLIQVLPEHINSLTLTELGAVCTGLFKSCTLPPAGNTMLQISDQVCSGDIQTIHSFFLVGILKLFRLQYFGYQHFFQYVANAVTPLLHLYPLSSCMQILNTYATMHICHPQLTDKIAEVATLKVDRWRSKDVAKLLWSHGTLQFMPDNPTFIPAMIDRIVCLQDEMVEYPIHFVSSLLSLAYLQLYPFELIDRLFSKASVKNISEYIDKTGTDLRRDMLLLDRSLDIECPEYSGNRLSEKFMLRSEIPSNVLPSIEQQLALRPEVRFITGIMRALLRREHYKIHSILPHMNTLDIEVRLDAYGQPIPFNTVQETRREETIIKSTPTSSATKNSNRKCKNAVAISSNLITNLTLGKVAGQGSVDRTASDSASMREVSGERMESEPSDEDVEPSHAIPDDGNLKNVTRALQRAERVPKNSEAKWLAVVVWSRNHCHYGGHKLLGQHAMKRRQLELLGYHVVDIPFQDWAPLMKTKSRQERIKYVKRKIFNNSTIS